MLSPGDCLVQVGDKIDYMKVVDGLQNLQVSTPPCRATWQCIWSHSGLATAVGVKLTEIGTLHDT